MTAHVSSPTDIDGALIVAGPVSESRPIRDGGYHRAGWAGLERKSGRFAGLLAFTLTLAGCSLPLPRMDQRALRSTSRFGSARVFIIDSA